MTYDRAYHQLWKAKDYAIDKELGPRYRTQEALQGETYTDFKKRIIKEELLTIGQEARKVYPAWIQMPGETAEEFRKRLVAIKPNRYPAWKRMPTESEQDFRKRYTATSL